MNNTRPARRNYTRAALELWLDRLASPWEQRFAPELVEIGRELYRQGCVRDIAITPAEAMVAGTWDDISAHVVFEWKEDGLHWRGSLDRPMHVDALAVAGLYEIEELLCEETPILPAEIKKEPPAAVPAPAPEPVTKNQTVPAVSVAASAPVSRLAVIFTVHDDALVFAVRWDSPGGARRPAFGRGAPDAAELSATEREALLRLAALARKNRFVFDAKHAAYRLEALDLVPRFVRDELPKWRAKFVVEGGDALKCFVRGVRETDLEAVISEASDDRPEPDTANDPEGAFALEWRLGLEGEWFPADVSRRLLRRGGGLMLVPGRGIVRLPAKRVELVADWPESERGRLPRYLLLSLFRGDDLKIRADDALLAWREQLLAPPEIRDDIPAFLRPYQRAGVVWLAHLAARGAHPLLADEMGLGKTLQVLSLVLRARPVAAPSLIVCPASVVPVWRAEIERFFPETSVAILGRHTRFDNTPSPRVWIAGYSQLRRHKALLEKAEFGYAVLDEAQFIKNPDAKVTQACLAIRAAHRIALSGTPVENRPADLWALFRFLMPGLLGRRKHFEDGFAADAAHAVERLRTQIAPFVLRRTKREVASDLPEKVESVLPCPLTDMQREEYRKLVEGGLAEFGASAPGEIAGAPNFLSLLTRLRQTACDPGLLPWRTDVSPEHSGKLLILFDRLDEIVAAGRKTVVFSQFTTLLGRVKTALATRFPETPVFELTGSVADREAPVSGFQKHRGPAVILVSLKAGGTGVTLTAGDYVFLLDPWWNPAVEAQAVDRVHRIGRERTVFVYRMTATDTVEDRIARLQETKRELFDRVVGDIPDMSDWRDHFPTIASLIAMTEEDSGGE